MLESPDHTVAIIDIGSNSVHLLVVKRNHHHQLEPVRAHKYPIRLGIDITKTGRISDKNIHRLIGALTSARQIFQEFTDNCLCVATHSIRVSENRDEVVAAVREATGITIKVVSGFEEARYGHRGALYWFNENYRDPGTVLSIDVGGGSTEFAVGSQDEVFYSTTIKVGAVSLTEKFFAFGPINQEGIAAMAEHMAKEIEAISPIIKRYRIDHVVAVSGTAKMILRLRYKIVGKSSGKVITAADVAAIKEVIEQINDPAIVDDRYDIGEKRAEVAYAGISWYEAIAEALDVKEWLISPHGPRTGMAADALLAADREVFTDQEIRHHAIDLLARQYNVNLTEAADRFHFVERVSNRLAGLYFGRNSPFIDSKTYDLLRGVCYLQECGTWISHSSNHKHSYYILANHRMYGFSEQERHIMALAVRFARKGVAHEKDFDTFPYLAANHRLVMYLAAVLRICSKIWQFGLLNRVLLQVDRADAEVDADAPRESTSSCGKTADCGLLFTVQMSHQETAELLTEALRNETEKLERSLGCKVAFTTTPAEASPSMSL